jgi:F0F1-type ATP synthase membrane subunit b/b'
MAKPIVRIYTSFDEYIDREMNDAEYKVYQADQKELEVKQAAAEAKATAKAALLDRLGITAEEATLLLS